ncbi:zinc-dependent alcohol dehydrogenase [Dactylosporangium sp. CS-033363]|uniref:zinc-dependent alcohol dehydrogenase n=1 Tax=Dactylosporangium sp. CS-033363 TaxID=3239935 RepID=UPI003D8AD231
MTSTVNYLGGGQFALAAAEPEPPGPGQVRIDVAYTGICGTDLHIAHGAMDHRVHPPQPIGHEMSGRIGALGAGVTGWSAGDAVTVMPLSWCGECPACLAGHRHICHRLVFVGIDAPGAMQSSWTVPAELLVRLPDGLALDRAALIEPTAVAVHDVRRSRLRAGERAVIVGAGPVGLLIGCVSRAVGAEVLVVEIDPHRRAVAQDLGFATADPLRDLEWSDADVAFEVSGSPGGVRTATDVLAVRGRLVVVAIHAKPREVDLHRVFWRELELIGVRVYDRGDFEEAARLVAAGEVPADRLISRVVPLQEAATAFDALEAGGVVKVLVDCGGAS